MTEILCTEQEAGLPALALLQRRWPAAPESYLRQLLRRGKVQRRGEPVGERDLLQPGDRLRLPDSRRLRELGTAGELTILYESGEILVIDKPAGVAVHRGAGHESDNLTARVEVLVRRRKEPYRAAPVHRLDAETSGPVMFAKGRRAAGVLGRLVMAGGMEKEYLTLVMGAIEESGRLTLPVFAKGKLKPAATSWQLLERRGAASLLRVILHTGRTHQIRRHLAEIGHPIAGDRRYGGPTVAGLQRLFLHACRIALDNPFDGARLEIHSPLPPDLAAVLAKLSPESTH